MIIRFAVQFLTQIFGDTPLAITVNVALIAFIIYLLWRIMLRPALDVAIGIRSLFKPRRLGTLEITPPARTDSHPLNTQSLFSILQQSMDRHEVISFEMVSTKNSGITYRVVATNDDLASIQKHFAAYIPELKFKLSPGSKEVKAGTLFYTIRQARHFAYPLQPHNELEKTDPTVFIAGSLTQLQDDEEVTLQLLTKRYTSREAGRIYNRLMSKGSVLVDGKIRYYLVAYMWIWIPALLAGLISQMWQLGVVIALVLWLASLFGEHKEKVLTAFEEQVSADIGAKLNQPLFQIDIRLSVYSPSRNGALANVFTSSLETHNTAYHQYLRLRKQVFGELSQQYAGKLFSHRLASVFPFNSSVLSSSELATFFHFPYGTIQTEGMVRSHSRTLPAPLSLKNNLDFDVVIGINKHHGHDTMIGLTALERERHMFIVGSTGSGKTTMLKYQIIQDTRNGKGLAVIDPHGDLAEELLGFIPEERKKDIIYLNPDDLDHPIGVNLLELPEGLKGNDLLREKDRITESVVSVMRKIFSEDDSGGHRIEYVLRNTVQTALTLEGPTLFTIFRLLNDAKFAKEAIKNLEDENLKMFWKDELGKAGSMQKVKMAAGVTAKVGRFLFSASARAILGQEKSTVDFNEILDGKVLICNFSKGRLGEDTSMLFGTTILAKLQLAALKRAERKQADRMPFYIYVDEFQNFATMSFVQMLSEARKYKVFLTMAEQSTSQQEDLRMVNTILANVGTVICFRSGNPADERLLLPLFRPYIEEGEIANLPTYNFYARMSAVLSQEPVSGETIVLKDKGSETVARQVIGASRANYSKRYIAQKTDTRFGAPQMNREIGEQVEGSVSKPTEQ